MAYQCPRCGKPVERSSSAMAAGAGGAVGALMYSAFASFRCKVCGPLKKSEFPPEVRQTMLLGTLGIVVGAIVLLVVAFALLILINK